MQSLVETDLIHDAKAVASRATGAPAFLVSQDHAGHWLARETHGLRGGLFTTREAAITYARGETNRRPGAVVEIAPMPISLG